MGSGSFFLTLMLEKMLQQVRCFSQRLCGGTGRRALSCYSIEEKGQILAPKVDKKAWIAPNAVVVGDVEIGEGSSVWWSACIRGDRDKIILGKNTNIQDGSVLHTDPGVKMILEDGVTVGHMAMLHGCHIKANSLIGIGATVLNRAVIGSNCLIGAGALVTEGKVIPDGSLVMGTNKIVRSLSEQEIEGLKRTAMGYVSNQQRYGSTLKKLD